MQTITYILEQKRDGTNIVKNFFLYPNEGNIMAKAHAYFSNNERKLAKLTYKSNNK